MSEIKNTIETLNQQFEKSLPEEVLGFFLNEYRGRIALASSMGAEDQVLTAMISAIDKTTRIFTLDTGRLFPETYDLIDKTNQFFGISIEVFFPDHTMVEQMVTKKGVNLFYHSIENRKECCHVRKIEPLKRAFSNLDIWVCGLRKDQSITRFNSRMIEWDEPNGLIKLNPLINWTEKQVWEYIKQHQIPYNSLHDQGFPSIGCQPCTRAIKPGEDIRAGRWWWEQPEHKECGLHKQSAVNSRQKFIHTFKYSHIQIFTHSPIHSYMDIQTGYLNMELLRFTTAGSVDDGKSTLIGRLLYDSKAIFADQLEAIKLVSERRGEEHINLALLTDGLRAEREQGITIDVAYRYFATPKRKFIIADTPGHIQYTRNMVTGASTANVAIILIDARNGVMEQTIRHAFIASLLNIPHIIVCINKMDMVDYSEEVFNKIRLNFEGITAKLDIRDMHFIPISALKGDNVVKLSQNMNWYCGSSLMYLLENIHIASDYNLVDARFPIQYIIRPNSDEFHDYRGYAGRIEGGIFSAGDTVTVLPSGLSTTIKSIDIFNGSLEEAFAPQSVILTLTDDIDISRGDMIVHKDNLPQTGQDIELMICWLNEKPLIPGGKYHLKHTSNDVRCIIKEVVYKVNIHTLDNNYDDMSIKMNDIARITIRTTKPLFYDSYKKNRITGSLVLIDEATNETVCAGMIV